MIFQIRTQNDLIDVNIDESGTIRVRRPQRFAEQDFNFCAVRNEEVPKKKGGVMGFFGKKDKKPANIEDNEWF